MLRHSSAPILLCKQIINSSTETYQALKIKIKFTGISLSLYCFFLFHDWCGTSNLVRRTKRKFEEHDSEDKNITKVTQTCIPRNVKVDFFLRRVSHTTLPAVFFPKKGAGVIRPSFAQRNADYRRKKSFDRSHVERTKQFSPKKPLISIRFMTPFCLCISPLHY